MEQIRTIAYIAFSDQGYRLAQELAQNLGGEVSRCGQPLDLREWTAGNFPAADALVYVGACGIAVRAIAPYVRDKAEDPAVVVIDERALNVIPILSGHLGGANDLARRIAGFTGSGCVITTATDINGVFPVDEWLKRQNCAILNKEKIVQISSAILAGRTVTVESRWPVEGTPPKGIRLITPKEAEEEGILPDITVDLRPRREDAMHLVPRICVLGVGCRRGIPAETLEERLQSFLKEADICQEAIHAVATIDLKKDEKGLRAFAEDHGWPLTVYSAEELEKTEGRFTPSDFVHRVTGVDNVCERSAVRAAGGGLIRGKSAGGGVTMALAAEEYRPDWEWKIL